MRVRCRDPAARCNTLAMSAPHLDIPLPTESDSKLPTPAVVPSAAAVRSDTDAGLPWLRLSSPRKCHGLGLWSSGFAPKMNNLRWSNRHVRSADAWIFAPQLPPATRLGRAWRTAQPWSAVEVFPRLGAAGPHRCLAAIVCWIASYDRGIDIVRRAGIIHCERIPSCNAECAMQTSYIHYRRTRRMRHR